MSQRHTPPVTVRPERTLSRCGLWAIAPTQLTLPFTAEGMSERITAEGRCKLTPDYDVLAWLCERWQTQPTPTGWMRPTMYELGSSLYDRPPTGQDYPILRQALERLAWVRITIDGYDAEHGDWRENWVTMTHLLELVERDDEDPTGLQRPKIRLAEWLRQALDADQVVRLPWRMLREFGPRQLVAKRLWIYLAAERWKPVGNGEEGLWITLGDRLSAALGMRYSQPRQARAALVRACRTVEEVDPRYADGGLRIHRVGNGWRLTAHRATWEEWCRLRGRATLAPPRPEERERIRAERQRIKQLAADSLASAPQRLDPPIGSVAGSAQRPLDGL